MFYELPRTHTSTTRAQLTSAALPDIRQRGRSARADTNPEVPSAKRPSDPPSAPSSTRRQPTPPEDGRHEVWLVRGLSRKRERSFVRLRDAMQFISSQHGGQRYDILMPNGQWFSRRDTIRRLRRASQSSTVEGQTNHDSDRPRGR
jgi:hypothetical protein